MKRDVLQQASEYTKAHRRKKRWLKVVTCLAAVVVFCTTYALILPAITMENSECTIPEHTHTQECYRQVTSVTQKEPICSLEHLKLHQHTKDCYDEDGQLICGYADFVVHKHDDSCYNEDGTLWCPLPEIEAHTHEESCYADTSNDGKPAHTHTDDCYTMERGALICEEPESEGHTHSEACYDENGALICDKEESDGHQHTDACYEWEKVLTCDQSTEPVETEPELICDKEEIILHKHTKECFDQDGNLICGQMEVLEHVHSDDCFQTVEVPVDTEKLTCTLPEDENHTHGPLCYGTWELICGKEGHTHSAECQGNSDLTEEEQAQVDEVIALIDALPTSEEVEEKLTAYDDAGDEEGRKTYLAECCQQVQDAKKAYTDLTDAQKEKVTNADKLNELEWLLDESADSDASVLTDDSAYVSELTVTGAEVTGDDTAVGTMSIHNGDTITYSVLVQTASYTDSAFDEGRVKLEFVLPLSEKQATFDLSAMTWLDSSEGYAPDLTEQLRVIDGKEVQCQVLTGYKLLCCQEEESSAIPGEFTGTVPVKVLDMAQGEGIALQISAAMEYGVWEGQCETHMTEEKLTVATDTYTVINTFSAEEQQAIYEQFLAEVQELEACGKLDDQTREKAEDLLQRLQEAYQQGQLTEEGYTELYNRVYTLLYGDVNTIAEAAEGTNWILLRDSGWFEEYSNSASSTAQAQRKVTAASRSSRLASVEDGTDTAEQPSDEQVEDRGGSKTSGDGSVSVSKTISGTDLENVFDITLQVQTSMNVSEISTEPDMAVVIVMDISNTMNSDFGGVTRYKAAMSAAENFLDQFASQNSQGISKVGYVAFNTDAHQIFGLQPCANAEQATTLKNTMRTQTGSIINASGYNEAHSRFTNVEAGLAMASDMLSGVSNKNKFIIFLSDGFPTTYISSGYSGYDPYDSTGRFYDHVLNKPCLYGTSYSDEAAIRARKKAAAIKNSGVTIFSIGVDVAGQTIQKYITQSQSENANANGFSVVDRTGTTYEIGDASSTDAYKNWLKNSIGSGYYYDSTDSSGLESAYSQIFKEIKQKVEEGSAADWVASDPIPTAGGAVENVEFIAFYDKSKALDPGPLTGANVSDGENDVSFDQEEYSINWDLKKSGYTAQASNGKTTYTYTLVYRVRLKNENSSFVEGTVYPTNDTTTLQYRTIEGTDGNLTVSAPKTLEFPIPSVHGYLAELTFTKVDSSGKVLPGAEFTLSHDTEACGVCRGDEKTSVGIQDKKAISGSDGTVSFTDIPSGHKYTLTETGVPDGYSANGNTYIVKVAYDQITVTVKTKDGTSQAWDQKIENTVYYELPETGGPGTLLYTCGGLALMLASVLMYRMLHRRKEEMQ